MLWEPHNILITKPAQQRLPGLSILIIRAIVAVPVWLLVYCGVPKALHVTVPSAATSGVVPGGHTPLGGVVVAPACIAIARNNETMKNAPARNIFGRVRAKEYVIV